MGSKQIFVFGATGFVGRNLLAGLRGRGYQIICLVRDERGAELVRGLGGESAIGDVRKPETCRRAIPPESTVVYLIHLMATPPWRGDFRTLDRQSALIMTRTCREAGIGRIIHISGLFNPVENLSRHLASRAEVCRIIHSSGIPATILRASIIFGPGSASYELLKAALKPPIVPLPPWRDTQVQPVAIQDVIRCLRVAIERQDLAGRVLDIGGPKIYTYGELLRRFAASLGLGRKFFNTPFEARPLAALLLSKLSGVGVGETYALLESLWNTSVVPSENAIKAVFGFWPTSVFRFH